MTTNLRPGNTMMLVCGLYPLRLVTVASVDGDGSVEAPTGADGALERWGPNGKRRGASRPDSWRLVASSPELLRRLQERLLWATAGRLAAEINDATAHALPLTGDALAAFVEHLRAAREMLDARAQATLAVDAMGRPLYAHTDEERP